MESSVAIRADNPQDPIARWPDAIITKIANHNFQCASMVSLANKCSTVRCCLLPTWEYQLTVAMLRQEALLTGVVGPKPTERTWRDEYVEGWMQRALLIPGEQHLRSFRHMFEPGGSCDVHKAVRSYDDAIKWKVDRGWTYEQAEAYSIVTWSYAAPLAALIRDQSTQLAASAHAVCSALAERAFWLSAPAPLLYWNLVGEFGLATEDSAWSVLLQAAAAPGCHFVTNGLSRGDLPNSNTFPDGQGFRKAVATDGQLEYRLQDSDVVSSAARLRMRLASIRSSPHIPLALTMLPQ